MRAIEFITESQEIHDRPKLDDVLARCIDLVHEKNQANPKKYGKVAACIIDHKNRKVFGINSPGQNGKRRHAERMAIDKYHKRYGKILPGAIIVTTLSPCNRDMVERDGPSCQDLLAKLGIEKVYSGYMDPSQHSDHPFTEEVTQSDELWRICKQFSDSFVHDDLTEGKIKLYTDPNHYGAELDNYKATGKIIDIPTKKLVGFEPDAKMDQPKSRANVKKIIAGLEKGDDMPPILVRKHKDGYQILDGHHRFHAYKSLKRTTIPAQIVPDSDIEEMGRQDVAEGLDEAVGGNYLYHATSPAGLKGILQSGYIGAQQTAQAATNAQTKLPSVAVTRDWNYAAGSSRSSEGVGQGAVIVFDRNSIESKYKTFGTSQSSMIKGLPNTTADSPQMKKLAMQTKFKDANKNGKLDYDELPAGAGGAALKHNYFRPKAGSEAEEAVVVPKGNLPLQGSMIGFWVDPKSELASDPAIMNDPRRLDMVRPNQFVKAKQEQSVAEDSLNEFAPGNNGGESGRWYTDSELADIIGDDWFEDFDVSNDGFNMDAHGEKAKQNLVGYANSWFDDKGYNVNVLGVENNEVDHDLQWYIVGSFYNPGFAKKDVEENFADGRNPQDKGDSKRYNVPTKSSVSNLRKVAKQGGRKGQLAHWMANMKAGRANARKK